jgi:hypothetical protein
LQHACKSGATAGAGAPRGTIGSTMDHVTVPDPREVDDALDLAIDRTIDAQEEFESVPPADPKAVPAADVVVHRAEDVTELAQEESPKAT